MRERVPPQSPAKSPPIPSYNSCHRIEFPLSLILSRQGRGNEYCCCGVPLPRNRFGVGAPRTNKRRLSGSSATFGGVATRPTTLVRGDGDPSGGAPRTNDEESPPIPSWGRAFSPAIGLLWTGIPPRRDFASSTSPVPTPSPTIRGCSRRESCQ